MPRRTIKLFLLVTLGLAQGCAHILPAPGRDPQRPTRAEHATRVAKVGQFTEARRAALDSALRAGDFARATLAFSEDAVLELSGTEAVTGRSAIQLWLEQKFPQGSGRLRIADQRLVVCAQGAYEWGGRLTLLAMRDDLSWTPGALYALKWVGPDNALLIGSLSFESRAANQPPQRTACESWRPQRSLPPLPRTQATMTRVLFDTQPVNEINDGVAARGWDQMRSHFVFPHRDGPDKRDLLHVSHRVRGPFVASGTVEIGTAHTRVLGFDDRRPVGNSYLTVERKSRSGAVTAGWQYRNVRLAAGPAFLQTDWSVTDEYRINAGRWILIEQWSSDAYSENKTGLLLEGIYAYPLFTRFAFVEARIQARTFSDSELRAEPFAEPIRVRNSGVVAGVSLGVGF